MTQWCRTCGNETSGPFCTACGARQDGVPAADEQPTTVQPMGGYAGGAGDAPAAPPPGAAEAGAEAGADAPAEVDAPLIPWMHAPLDPDEPEDSVEDEPFEPGEPVEPVEPFEPFESEPVGPAATAAIPQGEAWAAGAAADRTVALEQDTPTRVSATVPVATGRAPYDATAGPDGSRPGWDEPGVAGGVGGIPPGIGPHEPLPPRREDHDPPPRPSGGVSPGVLAALAVVFVASLVGLMLWWNGTHGTPVATPTTTAPSTSASAPETSSSPPASSSESSSESSSPSESSSSSSGLAVTLPEGAKECPATNPADGWKAWSGSPQTSCDFAENVRTAFTEAGGTSPATIKAASPVTSKTYTLTCSGDPMVQCATTTGALILLVPEDARTN